MPQLGWSLLYDGMSKALGELIKELEQDYPTAAADKQILDLLGLTGDVLDELNFQFDATFFQGIAPEFSGQMSGRLRERLIRHGNLHEIDAKHVSGRLPHYFRVAVGEAYQARRSEYRQLFEAVQPSELHEALERSTQWWTYNQWLKKQMAMPVFLENFGLSEVFVPLRCCWKVRKSPALQKNNSDASELSYLEQPPEKTYVRMLEDVLENWVADLRDHYSPDNAIMVIEGDPGSGKSSSVKKFAANVAGTNDDLKVVFIPLQRYVHTGSVSDGVHSFCTSPDRGHPILPDNLLNVDRRARNQLLLLIFDGLDELSKGEAVGAEAAADLVKSTQNWLANNSSKRVAVLFVGRPVAVSSSVQNLNLKDSQHLLLLRYVLDDSQKESFGRDVDDAGTSLYLDQRADWWKKFQKARGSEVVGFPSTLNVNSLRQVTAQPLLNYLVAISELNALDFDADRFNEAALYRQLFRAIWRREWGEKADKEATGPHQIGHPAAGQLDRGEFEELIEVVAQVAWWNEGRWASTLHVQQQLTQPQRDILTKLEAKDDRTKLMRLFLNQYVQARNVGGDAAFEFTHKTFSEYLTARRMIRCVGQLESRRVLDPDIVNLLSNWSKVFGPKRISFELFNFLRQELQIRRIPRPGAATEDSYPTTELESWRDMIVDLINHVIVEGMPMEKRTDLTTFQQRNQQAVASEESLLAIHSAICEALQARQQKQLSESPIRWPDPAALGNWLCRLIGNPLWSQRFVTQDALRWLNTGPRREISGVFTFWNTQLQLSWLPSAMLSGVNLSLAFLQGSNLSKVNLANANLKGALLPRVNLEYANLTGAKMLKANLGFADLSHANLTDADLSEADLTGAILPWANLTRTDLRNAIVPTRALLASNGRPAYLPDGTVPDNDEWRKTYKG
ncbi:MAG: pentapeptide repeat-containing protein [Planctomycetaceae bacterium]|nr:pentapeptide repeat-containing protein [Planctomycetaceae bacterium]MCB9953168.1 pentapeptide repeat-containing protein [Planctomycetaceae bacterium]